MATWQLELETPPENPRERELWLENAAGMVLLEDVRGYAIERIPPDLSPDVRAAVVQGINEAVYGLMMVVDGVTGAITSATHRVSLRMTARLEDIGVQAREQTIMELDLAQGDGMCMGYHSWLAGDFGVKPVARRRQAAS